MSHMIEFFHCLIDCVSVRANVIIFISLFVNVCKNINAAVSCFHGLFAQGVLSSACSAWFVDLVLFLSFVFSENSC